jgi:hypothetical protein
MADSQQQVPQAASFNSLSLAVAALSSQVAALRNDIEAVLVSQQNSDVCYTSNLRYGADLRVQEAITRINLRLNLLRTFVVSGVY